MGKNNCHGDWPETYMKNIIMFFILGASSISAFADSVSIQLFGSTNKNRDDSRTEFNNIRREIRDMFTELGCSNIQVEAGIVSEGRFFDDFAIKGNADCPGIKKMYMKEPIKSKSRVTIRFENGTLDRSNNINIDL